MTLEAFLEKLNSTPNEVEFEQTMALIEGLYEFTPASFKNGDLVNEAGQNSGSCKLFAFAQLHDLPQQQTLACFGTYYRDDVLQNPKGTDHQNIRNFMKTGWSGIEFDGEPLEKK
jgi:hypothetical protein